ncbi:MAG TPA: N-methyl-L-tryptophan oxidase [Thermomicrobiales bacterium]|jgi:sarcosine oxidase
METTPDVIVFGLGAMGSAAALALAKRGLRVLGLDAYERGHTRGSSHGHNRIIRQAYHEAPDYVPLIKRAYSLWRELEDETGRRVLFVNGGLIIGKPDGRTVRGTKLSGELYGLPYEELSPAEVAARYPGFCLPDDLVAVREPNAGFLLADEGVGAQLDLAARHGADLRHGEPVRRWRVDGTGVRVETDRTVYRADRLVAAPGPWSGGVLADLGLPLTVLRVVNVHFAPVRTEWYDVRDCPIFSLLVEEGHYYGIPGPRDVGIKIGRHDNLAACDPETVRWDVTDDEIAMLRDVLARYLPGAAGRVLSCLTCLYTMTPDKHFIVDRHPEHPQVAIACGFSGHGYKFAPVIGEILADITTTGATDHPTRFLSVNRFLGVVAKTGQERLLR